VAVTLLVAILAIAGAVNTWLTGTLFYQARVTIAPLQIKNGWRWLPLRWFAKGALCHFCVAHWVGLAFGIGYYLKPEQTWIAMLMMAAIYVSGPVMQLYALVTNPHWLHRAFKMPFPQSEKQQGPQRVA
jgi:hypothetical protein